MIVTTKIEMGKDWKKKKDEKTNTQIPKLLFFTRANHLFQHPCVLFTEIDPCSNNPCQNGGFCYRSTDSCSDYACICTGCFSGDHCEISKSTSSHLFIHFLVCNSGFCFQVIDDSFHYQYIYILIDSRWTTVKYTYCFVKFDGCCCFVWVWRYVLRGKNALWVFFFFL